jgi:hypothetical protein
LFCGFRSETNCGGVKKIIVKKSFVFFPVSVKNFNEDNSTDPSPIFNDTTGITSTITTEASTTTTTDEPSIEYESTGDFAENPHSNEQTDEQISVNKLTTTSQAPTTIKPIENITTSRTVKSFFCY